MEIIIYKNKHDLILFVLFNRREIDTEVIIIDQIINVISFKCIVFVIFVGILCMNKNDVFLLLFIHPDKLV